MLKRKQTYIPKVNNVDVTGWNAATGFTTDAIEFPESVDWALSIDGYSGITAGTPTISILHSNTKDGEYLPYKTLATNVDITSDINRVIFDSSFFSRYMKITYSSGSSTGTFSLILSK